MSSISNETTRVSGLISGLDTEELVKAATSRTKSQINTRKQKLQTLTWKQEAYRDVISKIKSFQDKYLDITSSSSIKANAVLKKCTATSSNDSVITATAAAGSTAGTYTVRKAAAATAATVSTENGKAAEGSVKLDFSSAKKDKNYSVTMKLDGAEKTVVFTGGATAEDTEENFLSAVNLAFDDITKDGQSFSMDGQWLKFNGGDDIYHTFEISKNEEGLGLTDVATSNITTSSTLGSIGFTQALQGDTYDININGVEFSFTSDTTVSKMMSEINNSDAGVTISFSNVGQSFEIKTKDTGAGQEINLYQTGGNLLNALLNVDESVLGTSEADSRKIEYDMYGSYDEKLSSVITDKLETGFESGGSEGHYFVELKMTDLNGNENTYALELDLTPYLSKDALTASGESKFEDETIEDAFGKAAAKAIEDAGLSGTDLSISYSHSTGSLTIGSDKGEYKIEIGENDLTLDVGANNVTSEKADSGYWLSQSMGNKVSTEMKFIVDGEEVTVTAANSTYGMRISDLEDAGLFTIRNDGTLVANKAITAVEGDDSELMLNSIFGKTELKPATTNDHITAYGSNSILEVSTDGKNFTTYTSATNLFTFDGTTINLTKAEDFEAGSPDEYITVETAKDTSGIKEVLTNFVNDYNQLLDDLYGVTSTSRPKSSGDYYDPLTEEQEEEMEADEIEKWNENAKTGLLYRDTNVQKFLSQIRSAMSKNVNGFTLSDMGITLTDDWTDNGKLKIDEAKMESAIEAYGDKIAEFFTDPDDGMAARLENVCNSAISTKSKNYGYLTSLAGMKGTKTDTDNQIYKQMQYIQEIIERLQEKYETEQERYWKKYTQLETYMNNMQNQSVSIFGDSSSY